MAQRGSYLNEDRREVIDNLARESTDRVIAETNARYNADAFNAALGQANTDRSRMLQGSNQLMNLADARQRLGSTDVGNLLNAGQMQQGLDQTNLDVAYDDFLRQFGYPQEMSQFLMSFLTGVPYSQTQTTTSPVAQSNPLSAIPWHCEPCRRLRRRRLRLLGGIVMPPNILQPQSQRNVPRGAPTGYEGFSEEEVRRMANEGNQMAAVELTRRGADEPIHAGDVAIGDRDSGVAEAAKNTFANAFQYAGQNLDPGSRGGAPSPIGDAGARLSSTRSYCPTDAAAYSGQLG